MTTTAGTVHDDTGVSPLERLRELVALETPSGDRAAIEGFADCLEARWRSLGAIVSRSPTPAGPVLIGDVPGQGWGKRSLPLLLIGHADTVWPAGSLRGEVPMIESASRLHGPGVFDMKAGIVSMEALVQRAGSRSGHPPLRLYVAPDEETGSVHSRGVLRIAAAGCRAALGFESPHTDGSLKVGRYGSARVRVDIAGRAAHAALDPEKGVSAIEELIDRLLEARSIADGESTAEDQVLFNIGSVVAEGRANVVTASASAVLGLRFPRPSQEEAVLGALSRLRAHRVGAEVSATVLSHRPAWEAGTADLELSRRLLPHLPRSSPSRGAADTNELGLLGIPRVDGLGPEGAGAHSKDEHVLIASLEERIESLVEAITDPSRW